MVRNGLIVGFRSLARDPMFTLINIGGLAIGLSAFLLIVLFIRHETSFDNWLPNADRTYLLQRIPTSGENAGVHSASIPYISTSALSGQFPEIEAATGLLNRANIFRRGNEPVTVDDVYVTDANALRVLELPFVAGDPARALARVDSIVLSETAARQIFGRTDVVDRVLPRITSDGDRMLRVTGVFRDLPANSHLRIGGLYRETPPPGTLEEQVYTSWSETTGWVYLRLRPGADAGSINRRMSAALRRVVPESARDEAAADGVGFNAELLNVRDVNTGPIDTDAMAPGTPMKTLATFAIVAAFLLGVACVNFTNLATARASRRAREVGLRKVLGATRKQLIAQFLIEGVAMVGVAGVLALALTELAMPALNALLNSEIEIRYFSADGILLPFVPLLAVVGFIGGAYPAFVLSRYRPAEVLKANRSGAEAPGAGRLRTALVILQFAVSITLIICTAIITAQTIYARSSDAGYRATGLLFVWGPDAVGGREQVETLMRRIQGIQGVSGIARVGITPSSPSTSTRTMRAVGATEDQTVQVVPMDGAAFQTLGMRILAGRNVTEQREADLGAPMYGLDPERDRLVAARGLNVVLDENAVRVLGFGSAQQAIGRQISPGEGSAPYTVVGVVNAARFESARLQTLPRLYFVAPTVHLALAVRFENADGAAIRSSVESVWKSSTSQAPFNAQFAEDRVARMYRADEQRAKLFAVFAGLAVLVSCLGLFGLAAFTAQRRTKEIGIRKVLGARIRDIVQLLVWQFTKPVVLANLIAWPIAWWVMRDWLNAFQNRIEITLTPFAFAAILAMAIAAGTIIGHAVKVARTNPIHALRYE